MLVYWAMLALPSLFSLAAPDVGETNRSTARRFGLFALFILFSTLIGLRYETGGDWGSYQVMVEKIGAESFWPSLSLSDPGFAAVSWLSSQLGFGLNGPTSFCGVILMYGLVRFARDLPDPWLAIVAAVPYLLIVVGMGYIRQGAAIGFILLALRQFDKGRIPRFLVRLGLALLFHISAICVLPLAGIVILRQRRALLIPTVVLAIVAYLFLLQSKVDTFYTGYVQTDYDSSGTLIRLVMNAVPATLFLIYHRRFAISENARLLWRLLSMISIAMLPTLAVISSSTALDRLGLYFIPVQLYVFGHLAPVLGGGGRGALAIRLGVIIYYAVVLFVWLNFADNSLYWIPYRFLLLQ